MSPPLFLEWELMMKIGSDAKKLFRKNRTFFLKKIPNLAIFFDKKIPSNVKILDQDDELDVVINGERFYGIDARAYAAQHIELLTHAPSLAELDVPHLDKDRTPSHAVIFEKLEKRFNTLNLAVAGQPVRNGAGSAYVFGLGLGFHLKPYMIQTQCRSLIVFEPEPMFLVLSMYFIDWKDIFKYVDNRLVFIFETLPDYAFTAARRFVSAMNVGVQQIICHTQHYKAPVLDATYAYFKKNIPNLFDGLGFYDDEKLMTRNHLLNCYQDEWKLLTDIKNHHIGTAVIVGAGPSLDGDIEWLSQNKDRVIIFSGGSALPTLLANGITPDFHVEIENIPMNYDLLSPLVEKYDLSKTVLVCSSTMDTRSARLFKRRLWFMREGVFASAFFNPGISTISWQNPTVVNTATSAALASGFRDILLLGADFGTRDRGVHHSKGSFYDYHEDLKKAEFKFPETTNANFGGVAYTSDHYLNGVRYLNVLMMDYRTARAFNGSDGVSIKEITPIKASRYKTVSIKLSKENLVNHIYDLMPTYSWKDNYDVDIIDYLEEYYIDYMADMKVLVKRKSKKENDSIIYFMEVFGRMSAFGDKKREFNPIFNGTIVNFTIFCIYWWRRVYESNFNDYQKLVRKELRLVIDFLEKDFLKLLEDVRQELPLVRPELFADKNNVSLDKV